MIQQKKKKPFILNEVIVAVKFAAMLQASSPGKNAGNGVGAGRPSLKVHLRIMLAFNHFLTFYIVMQSIVYFPSAEHLRTAVIPKFLHMMAVQVHSSQQTNALACMVFRFLAQLKCFLAQRP